VADEVSPTPGPFDVERIKALLGLMRKHDLTEIDLHDGTMRIRLRRGRGGSEDGAAAAPFAPGHAAVTHVPAAASRGAGPEAPAAGKALVEIKSPTPGTFYAAPSPDAEAYVRVGSRVTPSTVVCQIEAMKIFNEIQAECSGAIAEILVENQQAVEYGQVLFRVDPAG
jgi:acetyl-CoA carboxylase biotin carboxyl carrier protein